MAEEESKTQYANWAAVDSLREGQAQQAQQLAVLTSDVNNLTDAVRMLVDGRKTHWPTIFGGISVCIVIVGMWGAYFQSSLSVHDEALTKINDNNLTNAYKRGIIEATEKYLGEDIINIKEWQRRHDALDKP